MADKKPQAFRTIREVADWLGVEAHVLRFWESKFSQIKPVKRAGGRRYYRPADMALIGGIKVLLHDQGLTIRGVQKIIREEGVAHVSSLSPAIDGEELDQAGILELTAAETATDPAPAEEDTTRTGTGTGFVDIEALAAAPEEEPAPSEPEPAPIPAVEDYPAPEPQADTAPALADLAVEPTGDHAPSPLAEIHALLRASVPLSAEQRGQLAPLVARLDALAARLRRGASAS
ncbi:MerR family transcriptional regulator [Nioella sp.]|uniref:MerR family transcriptional regulator n=3 Tax=Nioella sp. TaxID=1912091 RepID=UPI0035162563